MKKIVPINIQYQNFVEVVDEIEWLTERYLQVVEEIKSSRIEDGLQQKIQRMTLYWSRLSDLIDVVEKERDDCLFTTSLNDCLQQELRLMEELYLELKQAAMLCKKEEQYPLWKTAEEVSRRMDAILSSMQFAPEHADRLFVQELILETLIHQQTHYFHEKREAL